MKHLTKEEREQLVELLDRPLHDERIDLDAKIAVTKLITVLVKQK